jgi:hypothetical protein
MINQKTLLLDQLDWDLVLDANGNIALATNPYSIAQDVASRIRCFLGECIYDTTVGVPYFESVLGQNSPIEYIKSLIINEAKRVTNVFDASVVFVSLQNRQLVGQLKIIDTDGQQSGVSF